MLAAVLWLGNISFTVIDNENHVEAVTDEGKSLLELKVKSISRIAICSHLDMPT
jgi:myosin heavy subunit